MQRVSVLVGVLWMLVGGSAAFQRGDFADGNPGGPVTVTVTGLSARVVATASQNHGSHA